MKTSTPQQRKQPSPGLGATGKALSLATCTALAGCTSGPQERPAPPSAPCPEGAVEAMKDTLGIRIGEMEGATFHMKIANMQPVAVREGLNSLRLVGELGKLPQKTVLTVNLYFADRVYGRVTQARTPQGDTFPVCMELMDGPDKRGMPREPNGGPDTVKVWSSAYVEAVDEFK